MNSLRLNNIFSQNNAQAMQDYFPSSNFGAQSQQQGIGPPDFSGGADLGTAWPFINRFYEEKEKDRQHQIAMLRMQQQGHLQDIGNQVGAAPQQVNKPMDVIFKDSIKPASEYQKGQLDLGQQKLVQQGTIAGEKNKQGEEKIGISKERADAYDFKSRHPGAKIVTPSGSGKMFIVDPITKESISINTGALNNEDIANLNNVNKLEQIDLQNQGRLENTDAQGANRLDQIGAQISGQKNLQKIRGDQQEKNRSSINEGALADIAARGNEARKTNAMKPSTATTTTSEKVVPGKPGLFGSDNPWLGAVPDKKTITTTNKRPAQSATPKEEPLPTEPPKGMKPGGKWYKSKYGPLYMEPD